MPKEYLSFTLTNKYLFNINDIEKRSIEVWAIVNGLFGLDSFL